MFAPDAPPTMRAFRSASGQHSIEALIDRYGLRCGPVRDLIVDYLRDRQPVLDYVSLRELAYVLGRLFWADLEQHHPGIDSLRLPREVAEAWKRRILLKTTTSTTAAGEVVTVTEPRANGKACMFAVRAFYLDITQRALEDPAGFGQWAVPSPISAADVSRWKDRLRHKAKMDQRTRERLPALPALVAAVDQRRTETAARLRAAAGTEPGATFTVAGRVLTRPVMPAASGTRLWAVTDDGARHDLTFEEHEAFWGWATVEVLRHTGIRAEELLELTHHSFIQYRPPSTGELVPLLQIAPSKTDTERLLLISPELADVLSAVISRVRDHTGAVPLVPAYDIHEKVWLAPMPLLFQRRFGAENRAIPAAASRPRWPARLTGPA